MGFCSRRVNEKCMLGYPRVSHTSGRNMWTGWCGCEGGALEAVGAASRRSLRRAGKGQVSGRVNQKHEQFMGMVDGAVAQSQ